ncbi:MAG: DUF2723 domain-containing protein [Bacteroidales bacterium]|nr:DUF2723 domain-containing protein [Bacteroidales bacterium]
MKNFKKVNNGLGWLAFAIAATVYLLTIPPTASWWDCGEYIATAYKLQVGHPPGAPLFQMLGRFFSLFAFGNPEHVAVMVNIMSALSSALTIMFLFWTITLLARKLLAKKEGASMTKGESWAVLGAGFVGAMTFTFADSFWFSAVEAEVYGMSAFFTSVTFWAILRWEQVADERHGYRWILLIAYLSGLAIGVHLLNLLTIPAIVYVYYFKKYRFSWKGFIVAGLVAVGLLGAMMYVIIPQVVNLAGKTELFFVNVLGLPFNSGTIFYFLLLIGLLVWGISYSRKRGKMILNTAILALSFVLIGYSSFLMLVIRANADTPINENNPKDAVSLLAYLNREQYGSWPLLYGQYYNAPVTDYKDGTPVYKRDDQSGKYIVIDDRKRTVPVFDPRFETVFPRMWSSDPSKPGQIQIYQSPAYGGKEGTPIKVQDRDGKTKTLIKPSFLVNLKFFFTYQLDHMFWRYFLWNFAGRQNDIEGQGEIQHGNWISGIHFIDNWRLGNQKDLPPSMQNTARTRFYFLPLILGILGLLYQLSKNKKDTWVVFVLFFMTGIAIIIYLNQWPIQPRERDYSFAGAFYAFAIWIGMGVLWLYDKLKHYAKAKQVMALAVTLVTLLLVPANMAIEGWRAHDRSGRYAMRDFAVMYLEACAPNAILITHGDNDTFPLWYAQEVEGIRTDVRVVNLMLASGSWYVDQLFKQEYNSAPLPLSIPSSKYDRGDMNAIYVYPMVKGKASLKDAIGFIKSDDPRTKLPLSNGVKDDFMPTDELYLNVDADAVVNSGTVPKTEAGKIVNEIHWKLRQSYLYRSDVMLLDLIATNNWKRPIYFANPTAVSRVLDVSQYCHMEGVVYRFIPIKAANYLQGLGGVDMDGSYKILMNPKNRWGRLNKPDVTVDRESYRDATMMARPSYLRTAQALVEAHRYDSAVRVLDKGIYFFPNSKFPFDYFTVQWADLYYQSGATEKGSKLINEIYTRYLQDLKYYDKLQAKFVASYSNEIRMALASLQRMVEVTKKYNQNQLSAQINQSLYEEVKLLQDKIDLQ